MVAWTEHWEEGGGREEGEKHIVWLQLIWKRQARCSTNGDKATAVYFWHVACKGMQQKSLGERKWVFVKLSSVQRAAMVCSTSV